MYFMSLPSFSFCFQTCFERMSFMGYFSKELTTNQDCLLNLNEIVRNWDFVSYPNETLIWYVNNKINSINYANLYKYYKAQYDFFCKPQAAKLRPYLWPTEGVWVAATDSNRGTSHGSTS